MAQNYMQLLPPDVRRLVAADLRPADANKYHHSYPYPPGAYEGLQPQYLERIAGKPSVHPLYGRMLPDTWKYGPAWRHGVDVEIPDFSGRASVADYVDPAGRQWELIRPWDREVTLGSDLFIANHHPIDGTAFWRLKPTADVASVCYTRSCQTRK